MEKIQFRALKFIYDDTDSTYEELLTKSKLPTLKIRRIRTIAIETFKIGNKTSPLCLHDLITIKQSNFSFRYQNTASIPSTRTVSSYINFRPLDCIFSILFVFCSLQKCQLSDMIDALIKRVSVTYKCLLSDSTEENKGQICANHMLQKSVLSDINDENVYQEIVALAIIGKIITTPFMTLVDSKTFATHILDKHFYQLQIDLKHWSKFPI
jgi:hypothetical protein